MTVLNVSQVIQKYLPLIRQKAHAAWRSLPQQTRIWLDYEDMVQDGVVFVISKACPNFRRRKAKLTTFLWHTLENHFKNKIWSLYAAKRCEASNVALEPLLWRLGHGLVLPEEEKIVVPESLVEMPMFDEEVMAVDSFLKTLEGSSPNFQRWVVQWFYRPGETKLHKSGRRFEGLVEEITHRGSETGLTHEALALLVAQEGWRYRNLGAVRRQAPVVNEMLTNG